MSNRIVIKAKDANIVKNASTAPGVEIQIDDVDPKSLATAITGEPELREAVESAVAEIDAADLKAENRREL